VAADLACEYFTKAGVLYPWDKWQDLKDAQRMSEDGVMEGGTPASYDFGGSITLYNGKAMTLLEQLGRSKMDSATSISFDMVFIDAEKKKYIEYYEALLDPNTGILSPNGVLIFDNVLWKGRVLAAAQKKLGRKEKIAQALHDFNRHVQDDHRTSQLLLPIRDGLSIIQVL